MRQFEPVTEELWLY